MVIGDYKKCGWWDRVICIGNGVICISDYKFLGICIGCFNSVGILVLVIGLNIIVFLVFIG